MQTQRRLIQDIYKPEPSFKRVYNYTPRPPVAQSRPHPLRPGTQPVGRVKPKRNFKKLSLVVIVFAGAGLLIRSNIFQAGENKITTAVRSATQEKVKAQPLKNIDAQGVETQVNEIIQKYPGLQIGVSFTDLKTSQSGHFGVEEAFIAASTPKLLTAALFLHQTEAGEYSLNDRLGGSTAQAQMKLMIEKSDNTAWANFNLLLKSRSLDQYAKEIGLQSYNSSKNTTTHADIALLLEKLYNRKLLNEENTKLLLSYMQNASEAQYIPAAVPNGVAVYHKAGYLKDRAHDAAIVDDGKRPFALVIFTKADGGEYDFVQGTKIMHDITNVILSAYSQI